MNDVEHELKLVPNQLRLLNVYNEIVQNKAEKHKTLCMRTWGRKFRTWVINVMPSFCTCTRCCCSGKQCSIVACSNDVKVRQRLRHWRHDNYLRSWGAKTMMMSLSVAGRCFKQVCWMLVSDGDLLDMRVFNTWKTFIRLLSKNCLPRWSFKLQAHSTAAGLLHAPPSWIEEACVGV